MSENMGCDVGWSYQNTCPFCPLDTHSCKQYLWDLSHTPCPPDRGCSHTGCSEEDICHLNANTLPLRFGISKTVNVHLPDRSDWSAHLHTGRSRSAGVGGSRSWGGPCCTWTPPSYPETRPRRKSATGSPDQHTASAPPARSELLSSPRSPRQRSSAYGRQPKGGYRQLQDSAKAIYTDMWAMLITNYLFMVTYYSDHHCVFGWVF